MERSLLFAVGVAAAIAAVSWFRHERARALRRVAHERGWTFDARDTAGISYLPLMILSASVRRQVENVLSGAIGPRTVTVFDLADPREASWGKPAQTGAKSLTCALVRVPATFPHLVIEPSDRTTLAYAPGLEPVGFESIEFGRRFDVRTSDRLDAFTIVDARLMAWLLDHDDDTRFELRDDVVTCATSRLVPGRVPELAETLVAFVERIPTAALARFASPPGG